MMVWLCHCPEIHAFKDHHCPKCGFKREETIFVGLGFANAVVLGFANAVVEVSELNSKLAEVFLDSVAVDDKKEIQWKAKVKCKASNCGAEEWVEWKDRHDNKCKKCWHKTEYTGYRDKNDQL